MPIPWTLQRYIGRELGKTFVLTSLALTIVLGLGGGVMNMIKLGEVTPGQLFRLLALVLPVSAALTLPLAALFSAAATYGRLSADNEMTACRSGGINLHVLLLPAFALSVVTAIVTFAFANYFIPTLARNLEDLIGADINSLVQQRLDEPRGIALGKKLRIFADAHEQDPGGTGDILLHGVAFVEVDEGEWTRFGTARTVSLNFERVGTGVRVAGRMLGLSFFDRQRQQGRFYSVEEQPFPLNEIPSILPAEIKFLTLREMFHYWSHPHEWVWVREKIDRVRQAAARDAILDRLWLDAEDDRTLTLRRGTTVYTITSPAPPGRVPRTGEIEFADATIEEARQDKHHVWKAERALVEVARGFTEGGEVLIDGYNVRAASDPLAVRPKETFGPVSIDPQWTQAVADAPVAQLLEPSDGDDDALLRAREEALRERSRTVARIVSSIHERLAFSTSVLVLVVLGAGLGIIFRGAHVLTAFGISFVPTLLVIVSIVMGKQMANNPASHTTGLMLIWAGIGVVLLLDVWTLTRVLRR